LGRGYDKFLNVELKLVARQSRQKM
jgi:hypothetical protein